MPEFKFISKMLNLTNNSPAWKPYMWSLDSLFRSQLRLSFNSCKQNEFAR